MTREELTEIAYRLAIVEPRDESDSHVAWEKTVDSIVCGLVQLQPSIKWEKFVESCHFKYWVTHTTPQRS